MIIRQYSAVLALALVAACGEPSTQALDDGAEQAGDEVRPSAIAAADVAALSCTDPVSADDTGSSLRARYGDDAQAATLAGGEGTELPGMRLWGGDPKRVVEVGFESDALERVTFIRVFEDSAWSLSGISTGDSLERLVEINGGPIEFYGFEWDYGGTVAGFGEGKLASEGGCATLMTLAYDYEAGALPTSLIGDGVVSSDFPDVRAGMFTVRELGLRFEQ